MSIPGEHWQGVPKVSTKARPLTAAQQELLDAMRKGTVVHYMRATGRFNPRAYYFRNDTMRPCTKQAEALQARGLVLRVDEGQFGDHHLCIKDAKS